MEHVVRGIGIAVLVIGVVFATMPGLMRRFVAFAKMGKRVYIGGAVRVVLGGLLLIGSTHTANFWIPAIIGVLILLTGILIFVVGTQRVHAYMDWWTAKDDTVIRISPIVASVVGILLIYAA